MEMKLTKCLITVVVFLVQVVSALQKLCKNSLTYFGDSGVKGSGKMVGLAAEHKGA